MTAGGGVGQGLVGLEPAGWREEVTGTVVGSGGADEWGEEGLGFR